MPPQILIPKYSTSKGLECFAKQIIKRASANSSDIQNLSKVRILPILAQNSNSLNKNGAKDLP